MLLVLFLIAGTAVVADGQLNIFAAQYASQLNITCELQHNVNFTRVISLLITKSQDGVDEPQASVNIFNTYTNHLSSGSVLGNISNDNMKSRLTLQWNENINAALDGTYTCTMVGLDASDLPLFRSQIFEFKLDDLDPVFTATPTIIDDGLTLSLVLECSMLNTKLPDNFTVKKIEIFKKTNATNQLLAYINSSIAEITTRDHRWGVIGSYFYGHNSTLYLAIKLTDPTTTDSGIYVCDFSVVRAHNGTSTADNGTGLAENGSGIKEHIVRSAEVTASDSTRPYVSRTFEFTESLEDYYLFACNFEKGNCGLNVTTTSGDLISTIMEDRMLGNGRNMNGHYLHNEFQFSMATDSVYEMLIVQTQLIPARTKNICVNLWLRGISSYTDILRIYVRSNNYNGIVWSLSGNSELYTGIDANTKISSYYTSAPFILAFEFQFFAYTNNSETVSIDDILITDINCD